MKQSIVLVSLFVSWLISTPLHAQPPESLEAQLLEIQQSWAQATYSTPSVDARKAALETLTTRAAAFSKQYPGRAEPLIWEGIVLSSYAGAKGGLGALGLAKQARDKLQAALQIDSGALEGSAYTSLGTLYYKVPGFPLGFGDRKKAQDYLSKALQLNPNGIDPNFFYGEYLLKEERTEDAIRFLRKAAEAPPRANRQLADAGRRKEALELLNKTLKSDHS